jgi:hypothetical protein
MKHEDAQVSPADADRPVMPVRPLLGQWHAPSEEAAYTMGAMGGKAHDADRRAFEAWMRGHCWALCARWDGRQYVSDAEQGGDVDPFAELRAMATRRLWAAWRDRAALANAGLGT